MAPEGRLPAHPVDEAALAVTPLAQLLREQPWAFDFFQAVRLLIRFMPRRAPIGQFAKPSDEVVRIGVLPSLSFPASQIQALTWPPDAQPSMRVNFIGLIGPLGLLPGYYTELVADRRRSRDHAIGDFFDLFHHRITSLFYQAWEKSRFTIAFERAALDSAGRPVDDPLTSKLYDLAGLGTPGLRNRLAVRDESVLFYGGLFGLTTRPASALESILSDFFNVDVTVEQFVGVWRRLEVDDQCIFEGGVPQSTQLGLGAVAGDEVWDRQSRARIRIGPLPAHRYLDFLPNGSAFAPLRSLVKLYCGDNIEFEVQLTLRRDHVPSPKLGDKSPAGPQLGWFTWLKSKPDFDRDPGDTVLLLA